MKSLLSPICRPAAFLILFSALAQGMEGAEPALAPLKITIAKKEPVTLRKDPAAQEQPDGSLVYHLNGKYFGSPVNLLEKGAVPADGMFAQVAELLAALKAWDLDRARRCYPEDARKKFDALLADPKVAEQFRGQYAVMKSYSPVLMIQDEGSLVLLSRAEAEGKGAGYPPMFFKKIDGKWHLCWGDIKGNWIWNVMLGLQTGTLTVSGD